MLINKILDCYYGKIQKKGLNKAVSVPVSMAIENSLDSEGWQEWKTASSKINDELIKKIEMEYHVKIPSQYIDYVKNRQFMDIEIDEYVLYGINENNTLQKILNFLPDRIVAKGFFLIGSIDDADFIVVNIDTGEIVRLNYEDYSYKEKLFKDFNTFIEFLLSKINC